MSGRCLGVRMWPERAHDRAPMQVNMLDFEVAVRSHDILQGKRRTSAGTRARHAGLVVNF